jgi:hypothetical protein
MFGRMSLLICQKQIEQKQPVRERLFFLNSVLLVFLYGFFSLIFKKDIRPRGIYIGYKTIGNKRNKRRMDLIIQLPDQ